MNSSIQDLKLSLLGLSELLFGELSSSVAGCSHCLSFA